MNVQFRTSFLRDLKGISDTALRGRVKELILGLESAGDLLEVKDVKRLHAKGRYYRIRVGDYRMGIVVEGNTAACVRFLHRSEIYRYFP